MIDIHIIYYNYDLGKYTYDLDFYFTATHIPLVPHLIPRNNHLISGNKRFYDPEEKISDLGNTKHVQGRRDRRIASTLGVPRKT